MSLLRNDGFIHGIKPLSCKKPSVISILDVGTSKICCIIATLHPRDQSQVLPGRTHKVEVIGIGHQRSRGIKSGVVINLDQAEQAIRKCVDAAERMANLTVESLIVNVSSGRLVSEAFSANVDVGGHEISHKDIARVLRAGAQHALAPERSVVHSLPIGYTLDGEQGILDPRGMLGETLGVDMHVLTAENAPLRNLELCINRAHLSIEAMVATPYASGLAALVDDESEMGSACIDMGGGTTTLSVFMNGRFIYCDAIAVGGHHVTMDLARGLSTRLDDAERLKVLHGSVLAGDVRGDDTVSVPTMEGSGQDATAQVAKSHLTRIIRPRIEETLELIRDRLARSGFADAVGKRVVLTGGACQLNGVGEAAKRILSKNVRIGRPMGIRGMPEAAKGPAFSTAVGLLVYPQISQIEFTPPRFEEPAFLMTGTGGRLQRLGQWLRQSL
ncbi:cell division protein FtsA [Salaquimonas pukyongi]|uniref:cell division protein FtsA n=1 Tax=Salaquimonas pukyongi TaxID=2712698 RepID=UPI00096BAB4A|nr:cell division protein FtsA [Salaquimonas pukyongi]